MTVLIGQCIILNTYTTAFSITRTKYLMVKFSVDAFYLFSAKQ